MQAEATRKQADRWLVVVEWLQLSVHVKTLYT
jgi:hypothetical protein